MVSLYRTILKASPLKKKQSLDLVKFHSRPKFIRIVSSVESFIMDDQHTIYEIAALP